MHFYIHNSNLMTPPLLTMESDTLILLAEQVGPTDRTRMRHYPSTQNWNGPLLLPCQDSSVNIPLDELHSPFIQLREVVR